MRLVDYHMRKHNNLGRENSQLVTISLIDFTLITIVNFDYSCEFIDQRPKNPKYNHTKHIQIHNTLVISKMRKNY